MNAMNDKWVLPRLSKKVVLCQSCIDGIDNLGWPAGLTFSCYGARIGVRTNNPELMERLLDHLPPHSKLINAPQVEYLYSLRDGGAASQPANSRIRRFHLIYLNTTRIMRTQQLEKAWTHLESALHFNVAMSAPKRIFVHAGVVGWKGRALLIPGRSRSGKSTLVAALVRAGATYYSDEYAVIDEQGRVHPYAKPLSLRDENGRAARVPIEKLSENGVPPTVGAKALPVGTVVMMKFQEGARWRPREVTAGQGVLDLLDNTVVAQQRPADALAYLNAALQNARVLHGRRGEAAEVIEALLQ
jgi:hypothetical protein